MTVSDNELGRDAFRPDPDTPIPVVAYVAIHGIGHQEEGQTAAEVAACFRDASVRAEATFERDDTEAGRAEHAGRLTLAGKTTQVRFVDGWWDGRVTSPSARTVLWWMFRVAPFMVIMTISGWCADLITAAITTRDRWRGLFVLLAATAMLAAFIFIPLVLLAIPFLILAGRLRPGSFPRENHIAASIIGDAWLYRSDKLDTEVLPALTALITDLRQSADKIMLVGHSQGAEIARRLALTAPVEACIWVGGALHPLAIARTLRLTPVLPWLLWGYVIISPLLASVLITQTLRIVRDMPQSLAAAFDTLAAGQWTWSLFFQDALPTFVGAVFANAPGIVAFILFLIGYVYLMRKSSNWADDLSDQLDIPTTAVQSLADPVSFGSSLYTESVRYVPIRPGRALKSEHVTYFSKPETGLALLEPISNLSMLPAPYSPKFPWWMYAVSLLCMAAIVVGANVLGTWLLSMFG